MNWVLALEIVGFIGGIAAFIGLLLAPMFYLGGKLDSFREEMRLEMKDFHGRLCTLEERYLQLMQKRLEGKIND